MNLNHDWSFTLTPSAPSTPGPIILSAEQEAVRHAIVHGTTDLAIIAAAGSGKTTTVVASIEGLLAQGFDKSEVLLLSFSKDAVKEINVRLYELGLQTCPTDSNAKDMMARTFHSKAGQERHVVWTQERRSFKGNTSRMIEESLCVDLNWAAQQKIWLNVLNTHAAEKLELRDVDEEGEDEELVGMFDIKDPEHRKTVQRLQTLMARLAAVNIKISVLPEVAGWLAKQGLDVQAASWLCDYSREVQKDGLWTFADMIIDWYRAGPHKKKVVIVDEAQDMDPILLSAAQKIAKGGRLIAVGDIRQCIHVWKGADPSIFQAFANAPTTKTVYLNENRRSVRSIVDLGNTIMAPYPYGLPFATSARGDLPRKGWWRGGSGGGAAYNPTAVVQMAEKAKKIESGKQVAVLTRTWGELEEFEYACFKSGLAYECKKRKITMAKFRKFKPRMGEGWGETIRRTVSWNSTLSDIGAKAADFPTYVAFEAWAEDYTNPKKAPVYLGTAHSSKGLTLDTVILVTNKRWNKPEAQDIEAERRLLYVAVTRAANELFIHPDEEESYPYSL
jgi:superfamily I DNA/RNA helicase